MKSSKETKFENQSVNWKTIIFYGVPIGLAALLILFILTLHLDQLRCQGNL